MIPQSNTLDATAEAQTEALLERMSLAEKIGQMTQVEKNSIPPEEVTQRFIGSVLSGGGGNPNVNTPGNWAGMVRDFQDAALESRLAIPLVYGVDGVHGHSNVNGAVIFPHNVGLGAADDLDLIARIAQVTARELLATNVHWNFAPAVSVPQDIRWGRTYEGFSEQTERVTRLGVRYVQAIQQPPHRVLASVKHFVADGGTGWGTTSRYPWMEGNWQAPDEHYQIDQGSAPNDEALLRAVHLPPYQAAIAAGAMNIMVSFSSIGEIKMHAHYHMLTEVLKGEFGFQGFLISDWMAVDQISEDYMTCVVSAINAGLDMIMVPYDYRRFIDTLTRAVQQGAVPISRIDDAVRRILRVKQWLGLFDAPYGDERLLGEMGSADSRGVAREAVRKSLVRLKDDGDLLPLPKDLPTLLVAGHGADNIGMQCGGWSINWQGGDGAITPGTSILDGIRQTLPESADIRYDRSGEFGGAAAPVGIVVVGEMPYAEGWGDNANPTLTQEDAAVIARMRACCDKLVVVLLSGRPLLIAPYLDQADAWVAAWLPGTEGAGVTDVLFGDAPFTGKSAFSWARDLSQLPLKALRESPEPPLFPFGHGL